MDLDDIKRKKINGDFVLASKIIGITPSNVAVTLERVNSKHHQKVKDALTRIITNREQLIASN